MFKKEILAERIKNLRIKKGSTQRDLSTLMGVTPTQISDLENGKTTTSIERLWLLSDYFDVSIDYLVGRSSEPKRR